MKYLGVADVLHIHKRVIEESGGSSGLLNSGGLESAVAQPYMTFGGVDLYPSIHEKASALGFSLVRNHPFIDGNKRVGHAAVETFLMLNGHELTSSIDEAETIFLRLAAGSLRREEFTDWIAAHIQVLPSSDIE